MESVNQSPRVLGNRYEVGDLLGRGGMAEVHLGRDTRLGRVVAIKLLRTDLARDPMFQARFRREAQSAAGLNHPAIVAVYDTGEETVIESGGSTVALPYIVMEYVEGRTLRDVLREGDPMEVPQALEVTAGVLSALDYSHRMGIVHRDIKPANVMLTASGDVKVMDFGIARALADVSATMTQTQAVIGTAQYLSPEQARGETVDARSDLYSAGCLLFELMTGRPPFVADSPVAVAYQHVREQPPPPSAFNPRVPEVVDRIVLHSLAKDREARYQTANDFRADLESALAGRAVTAGPAAASTVAMTAPAGGATATQATTEYFAPPPGGASGYGPPGTTQPFPGGMPQYPGGGPYGPSGAQDDAAYTRRGDRRAAASATNSRRAGFLALALAVVLVFAGAAYGVSYWVGQNAASSATVIVPTVEGDLQAAAVKKLTDAKLSVKVQPEASDTVPSGHATRVTPTGSVRQGTQVTLYVSSGTTSVKVPDIKGKTQQDARAILTAAGLTVNDLVQPTDAVGVAKGSVVSTDPAIGSSVARGSQVTLNISNGKIQVPSQVGNTLDQAVKNLNAKGITNDWIVVTPVPSDQTANTVVEQDPKDVTIDALRKITLYVAQAPDAGASTGAGQGQNGQTSPSNTTGQQGQNGQGQG